MDTPPRDATVESRRKFTAEEKSQLLANLDLEVAHRTRQFEESLAQILENFKNHHEGQVLRVPKLVRGITMAEFADKYDGDINECLRGLQRERQGGEPITLDPLMKKRKWKTTEDTPGPDDAESSRAPKLARVVSSPAKMELSKQSKLRADKTPGTVRTTRQPHHSFAPTSPSKLNPRSRSASPLKPPSTRPPSSRDFKPHLPKTPAYPRAPRMNESLMSVNGSPLANPYQLNLGAPEAIIEEDEEDSRRSRTYRRGKSIIVRRDPSLSAAPRLGALSRAASHSSLSTNHDRIDSPSHRTQSSSDSSSSIPQSIDSGQNFQPSAFMRVPTKDGLVLEFDPLITTPDELESLEGITDSAKKQAKEDMTKFIQAAMARWKI